jgi:hypothetical protein
LEGFDGFIVTYNSTFALLYEKFNKPNIIVNPTRYENPFTGNTEKWNWLNEFLIEGVRRNKILIISNNKGDSYYLKYLTGIDSPVIPSLCLYTGASYTGRKKQFILVSRVKNIVASSKSKFVQKVVDKWNVLRFLKRPILRLLGKGEPLVKSKRLNGLISYKEHALRSGYKWQDLYDFRGIVHIPYQISTMSICEEYSANMPLFFPSKQFLLNLRRMFPDKVLCELSFYEVNGLEFTGNDEENPNNMSNEEVVKKWISLADFYDHKNMPYIQYFESFEHLEDVLLDADCGAISRNMNEFNEGRKKLVFENWDNILRSIEVDKAGDCFFNTERLSMTCFH